MILVNNTNEIIRYPKELNCRACLVKGMKPMHFSEKRQPEDESRLFEQLRLGVFHGLNHTDRSNAKPEA
jgi:hypothetical protein